MARKKPMKRVGPPMKKRVPNKAPIVQPIFPKADDVVGEAMRRFDQIANPEPEVDTVEKVLSDMKVLCQHVDELMGDLRREMKWSYNGDDGFKRSPGAWKQFAAEGDKLNERLNRLVSWDKRRETIEVGLRTELGSVPPWSRPGSFIEWIGTVAVVCHWGGFMWPLMKFVACQPDRVWIGQDGETERTGKALVLPEMGTVRDLVRAVLLATTKEVSVNPGTYRSPGGKRPAFKLVELTPRGRGIATLMAQERWVQEALKAPQTLPPIPMPPHIRSIPRSL